MEEKIINAIREPLEKENIKLVGVHMGEEDNQKTLFVTIDSNIYILYNYQQERRFFA